MNSTKKVSAHNVKLRIDYAFFGVNAGLALEEKLKIGANPMPPCTDQSLSGKNENVKFKRNFVG